VLKFLLVSFSLFGVVPAIATAQAAVRVEKADLQGSRPLEEQTATAVIHNYLQSWQTLQSALDQNRADLLDSDFVGDARDKLASTIQQQATLGIRTRYRDQTHDLQIVFYSPEGLSVELTDKVEYDVELLDHGKSAGTHHVQVRYIAVLTPSESRWRVRVFQAEPQ
jgi:hypothetical protein